MKLSFFPERYFTEGFYELFQVYGSTFVTIGGLTYLICGDLGGMNRNPLRRRTCLTTRPLTRSTALRLKGR
jgi:hypothetical protein